jgi:hypothetical protein
LVSVRLNGRDPGAVSRYGTGRSTGRFDADPGEMQMKSLMFVAAIGVAALTLSACDEPYREETGTASQPMDTPVAPSATDQTAPVTDTTAPTTPSTTTLPADERSSEQSVQPESETLFY